MSRISVKGDQDGLIVTLPEEGETADVIEALQAHLEVAGAFFKGAIVTLDVGERELDEEDLSQLGELLALWEVRLDALRGSNERTRAAALALDLQLPFVVSPEVAAANRQSSTEVPEASIEARLVRRTLRSGQLVRHPGAVIVLGDVNPGAEIVAGGDIVVWGAIRGVVHAGAMGDNQAIVCALKLSPTQLRISDQIAIAPESKGKMRLRLWKRLKQGPEVARIADGQIVVEAWRGG